MNTVHALSLLLLVILSSFLDVCHVHCFTTLTKDCNFLYACCVFIPLITGHKDAEGIELLELCEPE